MELIVYNLVDKCHEVIYYTFQCEKLSFVVFHVALSCVFTSLYQSSKVKANTLV